MKIGYATTFDSQDVDNWSGTPFFMANGLKKQFIHFSYIGKLKRRLPINFRLTQLWKKFRYGERESPRFNCVAAKKYSLQLERKIAEIPLDVIIAPQINPIAYFNGKTPLILWTDALYAGLSRFYPGFTRHSESSIQQGHEMTQECLGRLRLAIFSSDWAANVAIQCYGLSKEKVKVVPFGANFHCDHTKDDVMRFLKLRSRQSIKLLFIGKDWDRKGGEIAYRVAKAIHRAGFQVELNIVGCAPPERLHIPNYIYFHGVISKKTTDGLMKIKKLLSESHFLFVPSRAEAYGIVFCEANAFGLPCISSNVGGIETIIKNGVNGRCFSLNTSIEDYVEYIIMLMQNYSQYEALALSSFHEYEKRLNWEVATKTVKGLIEAVV